MWEKFVYILVIMMVTFLLKHKLCKTLKNVEYYIKFCLIFSVLQFITFIHIPLLIWNGKNVKNGRIMAGPVKVIAKLLGITWHIRNAEILSENSGAVIISNHQSILDIMHICQLWLVHEKVALVAKKELLYFWTLGFALYMTDAIFLDRRNPTVATQLLLNKSKNLFQNKIKLLIFPEGTRNSDFTKFLPFKKGAFNIAVQAQVPIIPFVVSRYYFLNHTKRIFSNGHVIVKCLDPVSTEGLTMDDIPDLINRVQGTMEKVYQEMSHEVTKDLLP